MFNIFVRKSHFWEIERLPNSISIIFFHLQIFEKG